MAPIIGVDALGRKTYTFAYTGAIETFELTENVLIEVFGASGGNASNRSGGKGAKVSGVLSSGQVLKILVGGKGGTHDKVAGGGGGSYISLNNNTPVLVAGGGGGSGYSSASIVNGLSSDTLTPITTLSGTGGKASTYANNGGGGFHTNASGTSYRRGGAFVNGGGGGGSSYGVGGFGGGGGGDMGSGYLLPGSGGGYIGGDASAYAGTSYINTALVSNYEFTPAIRSAADGLIVMTVWNATPNANLSAPTDATTLYENTAYTISGNATDADNGNIVNIKYSINDGTARALATGISDGTTAIPFSKTLTFKNGKLFDGETAITDSLAEGTAHMLRVWATDDQGATSTIISRSFYAVPNRAPSLTVDTPQPTGSINSDKFAITGTCSDIDGNEVTVAYRINGANPVQIYKGQGGAWSFDVSLSALQVGANSIVIEVTDSYNFKATKTVRLNKNEIKTPVNTATARYKLTPPKGSATGVLLWVRRTETLQLDAKISMTLKGEQEQYFAPTDEITTAQVSQGIVEDEFIFATAEAKTDIVLKLEMTKTQENDAITLITGVFN